jgi:hypothetical protein
VGGRAGLGPACEERRALIRLMPGLRAILVPFAATRLALLVAGCLSAYLLPSGLVLQKGNLVHHRPGPAVLEIWARWDAEWYLLIAERGYGADDAFVGLPVAYQRGDDSGFFPLYPALIRVLMSTGIPSLLAGVVVSNLALLAGLWLLRDLVRRDHGDEVADRTVWILLAFPTSFFFSAVYAESVMLASLLGAVWMVRAGRPYLAGGLGALCALSRPTGILVLLPLLVESARATVNGTPPGASLGRRAARLAGALLPPGVALLGYMLYCREQFGTLAPFLARQERWRGATSGPWRAFERYLESPQVHGAHNSTIDLVVALALVLSIPWLFRRLRASDAIYATASILIPLGSTLWSFSRLAAVIYPIPILVALWTRGSERRFAATLAAMLPVGGLFMALFAAWWWVG